jgi:hypothetical protein
LVVLAAIPKMLFADLVPWVHVEPTFLSHQRQVLSDRNAAMIEENVVVGTQTKYVV